MLTVLPVGATLAMKWPRLTAIGAPSLSLSQRAACSPVPPATTPAYLLTHGWPSVPPHPPTDPICSAARYQQSLGFGGPLRPTQSTTCVPSAASIAAIWSNPGGVFQACGAGGWAVPRSASTAATATTTRIAMAGNMDRNTALIQPP